MRSRLVVLALVAGAVIIFCQAAPVSLAQTPTPSPLTGLTGPVTSAEEGPMEGVVVSAAKAGSTITVSVVSDQHGRYQFPRARLEPGRYSLSISAVGYDLERAATVELDAAKTSTADLKLGKARDLASQLSNTEWLMSFPGTEQQKASVRNCAHCRTLVSCPSQTLTCSGRGIPADCVARRSHVPDMLAPPALSAGRRAPEHCQRLTGTGH